jgi:hypothetical protein
MRNPRVAKLYGRGPFFIGMTAMSAGEKMVQMVHPGG